MVLSTIPKILFFDVTYERMKSLRLAFESTNLNISVIGKNQVEHKIFDVKSTFSAYKTLLNQCHKTSKQMQIGMLGILIADYPNIVLFLYQIIIVYYESKWWMMTPLILKIVNTLTLLFTPAILSELINIEYEKTCDVLRRKIAACDDVSLREVKQRAYDYIKMRPYKFFIVRAVSLDVSMPLSFIGFCIGHLIVILQNKNSNYELVN
ncbi:uncharacterized protein LOC123706575 [Pieris brassicae]|uniref:uncharacterized protein LOC123706575 n=1 Tax=Pieris brassicae TaxID=7116 RepID=UPI001E660F9B|nr:uncharacterized protein LOC123706575 [Pieris brassicae]